MLISIENLYQHPNNPRLQIGDTTELSESIRAKGVLQNLTVVPADEEGDYTVIIGHRRLVAAMEAGLTELPCNVVKMTPAEQMETMLMENMQRSDLTPYEEAQGFQMMLNLGTPKTKIAEKTGFSQSTINHRLKLLDLDQNILKDSQVSINNLIALEKIEDVEVKNKILQNYGGSVNFNQAVEEEHRKIIKEKAIKRRFDEADELGVEIITGYPSSCIYEFSIPFTEENSLLDMLTDRNLTDFENLFIYKLYDRFGIYKKITNSEDDENEETEEEKEKRIAKESMNLKCKNSQNELAEVRKRVATNYASFLSEFLMKNKDVDAEIMLDTVAMLVSRTELEQYGLDRWLVDGYEDYESEWDEDVAEFKKQHGGKTISEFFNLKLKNVEPKKIMLASVVMSCERERAHGAPKDAHGRYIVYDNCVFKESEVLDIVSEYLISIGYIQSEEEKAYLDGTHEAYMDKAELVEFYG